MSQEITLFTDYQKRENLVTNYCGLILKLVYEESPQLFNRFLDICCAEDGYSPIVGPVFEQQKKMTNSMPDLLITQHSFQVMFEVKTTNWYHKKQLTAHTKSFEAGISDKVLILLCNFDDKNDPILQSFKVDMKSKNGIIVILMTFEELYEYFKEVCRTPMLRKYLDEFGGFLDRNGLFPLWKYTLDVVNCVGTREEVLKDSVYMCPDTGRQYHHKRAKYFGTYWEKTVENIYEIDAVVSAPMNFKEKPTIKWNNSMLSQTDLQHRAIAAVKAWRIHEIPKTALQVFLLSHRTEVNFSKDTAGGLYGSKIYFECPSCKSIGELEKAIKNKAWSNFPDRII